jgi:sigma-E factor negative regulatory protein RseA
MKDKLSALKDGDLDAESVGVIFDSIRRDRSLRTDWEAYCAIGDVLRGDREGAPDFVARVMAEIDAEPARLVSSRPSENPSQTSGWRGVMPLAASVMGVAAVGWVAHTLYAGAEGATRVASAVRVPITESVPVSVRPVVTVPQIDPDREYLFAHQSMTGGGPISGAIQHVRTVSDAPRDAGR